VIYLSEHKQLRKSSCFAFSSSVAGAVPISACRNILGKAAALHLILTLFCGQGCAELSLQNIGHSCANILIGFSLSALHSPCAQKTQTEDKEAK
jgi:hypothetical protein